MWSLKGACLLWQQEEVLKLLEQPHDVKCYNLTPTPLLPHPLPLTFSDDLDAINLELL